MPGAIRPIAPVQADTPRPSGAPLQLEQFSQNVGASLLAMFVERIASELAPTQKPLNGWSPVSIPATEGPRACRSVGMETDAHPTAWIPLQRGPSSIQARLPSTSAAPLHKRGGAARRGVPGH